MYVSRLIYSRSWLVYRIGTMHSGRYTTLPMFEFTIEFCKFELRTSRMRDSGEPLPFRRERGTADRRVGFHRPVPEYGELQGRDSNGLYWRDIFKEDTVNIYHGNIYFGYAGVSEDKKAIYDKVIESARFKSKPKTDRLLRSWFMKRPYAYRHRPGRLPK